MHKIDLLDNLLESSTPNTRHWSGTSSANSNGNNSNNILSPSSASNNNINTLSSILTPSVGSTVVNDLYSANSCESPPMENARLKSELDNAKDPYLVDVDVDVDGVMMDGLDQVEYMNRGAGGSGGNCFYGDDDDDLLLIDEEGDIYGGDQGTRFTTEPISRTLEALALEGLTEF